MANKLVRYYLIPFEDSQKAKELGFDTCPKYLRLIGTAHGVVSKPLERVGSTITKFKVNYFLIKAVHNSDKDFEELESKSDVIRIDRKVDKAKLSALGIDTKKVVTIKDIQRKICKWLIDEDRDFASVAPLRSNETESKVVV